MTSQNNPLTNQRGSALIVTMLLVGVLLMTALILLQRIVPYAKSVRSMHEASLAYYLARGQADLARYEFLYGGGGEFGSLQIPSLLGLLSQIPTGGTTTTSTQRGNISPTIDGTVTKQVTFVTGVYSNETDPKMPTIGLPTKNDFFVVSANNLAPLSIKLFATDALPKLFGTSITDPQYHILYSRNAGGLRFDLRGVDTGNTFKFLIKSKQTANIKIKMEYLASSISDSRTFTAQGTTIANSETNLRSFRGNIQNIDSDSNVLNELDQSLTDFLNSVDCRTADTCSFTIILDDPLVESIDFQLISNEQIPDLNAVVIGDGLSGNNLYYQRVIDFIETPQDI